MEDQAIVVAFIRGGALQEVVANRRGQDIVFILRDEDDATQDIDIRLDEDLVNQYVAQAGL